MVDLATLGIASLASLLHDAGGAVQPAVGAAESKELADQPAGIEAYLHVGDSQTAGSRLQKAYAAYTNAYRGGRLQPDRLNGLVNELVDILKAEIFCESDRSTAAAPRETSENDADRTSEDGFTCMICHSLWYEPTTIECGHTYCRACLEGQFRCVQCDAKHGPVSSLKTNVLMAKIAENCFPEEVKATKLKQSLQRGVRAAKRNKATIPWSNTHPIKLESSDDGPVDRAFLDSAICNHQVALAEAQTEIKLKPDCPKGYYQRGVALSGLGLDQSAVVAYLQCLALDPNITSAKTALAKVLQKVLSPATPQVEPRGMLCATSWARRFSEDSHVTNLRPLCGCKRTKPTASPPVYPLDSTASLPTAAMPPTAVPLLSRKRSRASADHTNTRSTARTKQFKSQLSATPVGRHISASTLSKEDLECSLCLRLLHNPVTTPCGHVFCRGCLYRCLDHSVTCPLCKGSLTEYLAERRQSVTESMSKLIETYFSGESEERRQHEEHDIREAMITSDDHIQEIPIFVCTLAYPTIPCPLHVYEPRYRLMVRRCMQSGSAQFGMCVCFDEAEENYSEFGCTLEVRNIQYLMDGRSVLDTVGGRRFRVLTRSMKDGYQVATVQFLQDKPSDPTTLSELQTSVYAQAAVWFNALPSQPQSRICHHFGALPPPSPTATWVWWLTAVLPIDRRVQLVLLSSSCSTDRLATLRCILAAMRRGMQCQ